MSLQSFSERQTGKRAVAYSPPEPRRVIFRVKFLRSLPLSFHKMTRIIISNEARYDPIGIEIPDDLTLKDLCAYIEAETGVPSGMQMLHHNNILLEELSRTVSELGIAEGDLIVLTDQRTRAAGHDNVSSQERVEMYRQQIQRDLQLSTKLRDADPDLFSRLSDSEGFRNTINARLQGQNPSFYSHDEEMSRLHQNYEDPENQAKILEMIRQQQVEENLQLAYDISPESFVSVNMLYIKLRINGHETFALVDSGAQQTIIHPRLAEEFGILKYLDKRFAAMSLGIGSAKSEGRIHSVPVSLGDSNLEVPCSFTVIETHVGILFGLDMLRRHKCNIDLGQDALLIGDHKINFLSESETATSIKHLDTTTTNDIKKQTEATLGASSSPSHEGLSAPGNFADADLTQLISLGFTRQEAIAALKATSGNVELAASLLFQ